MAKKTKEEKSKTTEEKSKVTEEKRIVVFIEWEGFTKELYEEARKQVNLEGDSPKGLMHHFAGFNKNGIIRVADIWESEEDFNNYVQERLIPVAGKMVDTKPKVEIYQLHASLSPKGDSS